MLDSVLDERSGRQPCPTAGRLSPVLTRERMPGLEDSHSSGPATTRPSPIAQAGKGYVACSTLSTPAWPVTSARSATSGWPATTPSPPRTAGRPAGHARHLALPRPAVRPLASAHRSPATGCTCCDDARRTLDAWATSSTRQDPEGS